MVQPQAAGLSTLATSRCDVPNATRLASSIRGREDTHRLICFLACLPCPLPSCPACPWPNNEMLVALSSARPPHFGRSHPPWPDFGPSLASASSGRPRNRSTQRWRPRLPSFIDKRTGTLATTLVSDNTLFYAHRFEWSWPSIQSPRSKHVSAFSFRETVCRNDPGENVNTVGKTALSKAQAPSCGSQRKYS